MHTTIRYHISYFVLFVALFSFFTSSISQAHSRGESYSKWHITEDGAALTFTLSLKDIGKLTEAFQGSEPNWDQRVAQHIQKNTQLFDNDLPCKKSEVFIPRQANGYLQIEGKFFCHSTKALSIKIDSIFNIDSRHMHIARINFSNTDIQEKVFLENDREWKLYNTNGNTSNNGSTALTYFILGAEHIASGWDHLAFLATVCLLLLLMKASLRMLFLIISGFTLGHSASLILTVLGYLSPNSLVVESMIAFSIALLAIESIAYKTTLYWQLSLVLVLSLLMYALGSELFFNSAIPLLSLFGLSIFVFSYFNLSSKTKSTQPQLLLTLLFGLVHGFGFAGSLQDIGLPTERLVLALISFNLGVETGQILIVGLALYLLSLFQKYFTKLKNDLLIELSAASLCGLGLFWFIERSVL